MVSRWSRLGPGNEKFRCRLRTTGAVGCRSKTEVEALFVLQRWLQTANFEGLQFLAASLVLDGGFALVAAFALADFLAFVAFFLDGLLTTTSSRATNNNCVCGASNWFTTESTCFPVAVFLGPTLVGDCVSETTGRCTDYHMRHTLAMQCPGFWTRGVPFAA